MDCLAIKYGDFPLALTILNYQIVPPKIKNTNKETKLKALKHPFLRSGGGNGLEGRNGNQWNGYGLSPSPGSSNVVDLLKDDLSLKQNLVFQNVVLKKRPTSQPISS